MGAKSTGATDKHEVNSKKINWKIRSTELAQRSSHRGLLRVLSVLQINIEEHLLLHDDVVHHLLHLRLHRFAHLLLLAVRLEMLVKIV